MSGKFMHVKKICINTLTLLVITSQLCGCSSATQKEMLNMYNNNQSITIEVATPISQEQGTEVHVEWTELASLNNYETFRMEVDDALGITAHGTNGKNGVLYVDLEGNHTNNSTLFNAFANQKFRTNVWENSDASEAIIDAAQKIYTDVDSDKAALLAGYNAYYNLLNDSEPGYANMYSTITRLEAMAMIFKADTPVYEITVNDKFASAVENEQLAPYAQEINNYSFLKADDLSLDGNTANSTITRAEFVYMVVQRYFADEYSQVTGKESCYSDIKNGGNVAEKIGLIKTDKETGAVTVQNRCDSYELSYCIQVEKAGVPEELYKAMVVAQQKGLITGSECRWSDGLIKGEALTILTNAYQALAPQTNADRGNSTGTIINGTGTEDAVIQINWDDINPATHSTFDSETGTVTIDDTLLKTMAQLLSAYEIRPLDTTKSLLCSYLQDYYKGNFGDDEWLQFALTGDSSVLNLSVTDADLLIQSEQAADAYFETEEGQKDKAELESAFAAAEEGIYQLLADSLGISIDEAKSKYSYDTTTGQVTFIGNQGNSSETNGGGGSSPAAGPNSNTPSANEGNFETPGTNGDTENDTNGPGEDLILIPGAAGDGGERGPEIPGFQLNY